MMNRRQAIHRTLAAGVTAPLLAAANTAIADKSQNISIIDTNITLFHWPFRRLPLDNTDRLVAKLRSLGVSQAWAGSFEGLLHRDISSVNLRVTDECKKFSELLPIGTINPVLPGWQEDLRRCCEVFHMPGIRLYPNYHGYDLNSTAFASLLSSATKLGLIVQIAVAMEDNRTQSAILSVPDVDLTPLALHITKTQNARVQILNHRLRTSVPQPLITTPGICFDTARVDGTDGIPTLASILPPGRIMHGTHAPVLIPEAALIRSHESGKLDEMSLKALLSENARQFLEHSTT